MPRQERIALLIDGANLYATAKSWALISITCANLLAHHLDDWYIEEQWVNERLFEHEIFYDLICDLACGLGPSGAKGGAWRERLGRGWGLALPLLPPRRGFPCGRGLAPAGHTTSLAIRLSNWRESLSSRRSRSRRARSRRLLPLTWITEDQRSQWLEQTRPRRVPILTLRPCPLARLSKPGSTRAAARPTLRGTFGSADITASPKLVG
jgi:hypothetical protein